MSVTPGSSNTPSASSPIDLSQDDQFSKEDTMVLEYLRKRGLKQAEQELREQLAAAGPSTDSKATTVSTAELVKKNAPAIPRSATDRSNSLADPNISKDAISVVVSPLLGTQMGSLGLANLMNAVGGVEDALATGPTDRHDGFRDLEAWVDGSLDMYRPEFRPILFPIFCHFYLDLVEQGLKDAALDFFRTFSPSLATHHLPTLRHLQSLSIPSHVGQDELARRFRNEKYLLRMSRSGFRLLVGWLTEGTGGEAAGAGDGFTGESSRRGRSAVMQVVNNHVTVEVLPSTGSTANAAVNWEENTGLVSALIPDGSGRESAPGVSAPQAFNSIRKDLRLGLPAMEDNLRDEVERTLREESMLNGEAVNPGGRYDPNSLPRPFAPPPNGHPAPTSSEQLPMPPQFKTVDVRREVEKIRDARKRIRLDPAGYSAEADLNGLDRTGMVRARALPSICAYTFHDANDGIACSTFSQDTSILAAGFSESYIRLWNIKGEKLKGMKNEFQLSSIKDSNSLKRVRERGGNTTRKLIGHSGPVYSLSFDPLTGSAAPPKHLLSASADATVRLWSLDTMTNLVAYRGHQNPVWDVEWSPMGIYFATASRDRTARLWSTDRSTALRIYAGHQSDVDCVRFHPNALYLATGSSDNTCRLWDVQKGSCVRVFLGHQGAITSMAMTGDGRYLASAGEDLAINLWDLGSGRRVKKMTGHTGLIHSLAFSAESTLLVSGSADWTVRCWDVKAPGGLPTKRGAQDDIAMVDGFGLASRRVPATADAGALPTGGLNDGPAEQNTETTDLLATFPTKRTPIINVQFTPRNLCLVSGSVASGTGDNR
ncbi:TFIID and SAGA subunit [Exidia glandulosa HHB12029]|uniref:TFIID and SAGA subunit n=1 Tax=Exidia glandulosa HHB12029 TaxID=1314781 RepID=A0A166BMX0_EXIGL|nr:TFIID and SAGA subunit [Exidia glandulosa HHB12029]